MASWYCRADAPARSPLVWRLLGLPVRTPSSEIDTEVAFKFAIQFQDGWSFCDGQKKTAGVRRVDVPEPLDLISLQLDFCRKPLCSVKGPAPVSCPRSPSPTMPADAKLLERRQQLEGEGVVGPVFRDDGLFAS